MDGVRTKDLRFVTARGERVPALGLGTWLMRGEDCERGVAHALELGYRHIDTAQAYKNESEVGKALAASSVARDDYFLTTKIEAGKYRADDVIASTEKSLRQLGVDFVDLLLIHWPTEEVPLEETLDAMQQLQADGRTRHLGVSNFTPSLLQRSLDHADIFSIQVEYHPYLEQDALRALAEEHDLMLTAYSPIARGNVIDDETLNEIADTHGKSAAQVALRWLIQQPQVAPIPKASSPEHREANFDIFDFELSDDEMSRIHNLARGERLVDPGFAPDW